MKIDKVYPDGSKSMLFEEGDTVKILQVPDHASWLIKVGEHAKVYHIETKKGEAQSFLDRIQIRTQTMIEGNWGVVTVPSWYLEYVRD